MLLQTLLTEVFLLIFGHYIHTKYKEILYPSLVSVKYQQCHKLMNLIYEIHTKTSISAY